MYSVKPGRGPSMMGALGSVVGIVFIIFWIGMATSMGAPALFPVFGGMMLVMAVVGLFYNLYNATQRDRLSSLDITSEREESDPLQRWVDDSRRPESLSSEPDSSPAADRYCPYCGVPVEPEYNYCPKCGKDI